MGNARELNGDLSNALALIKKGDEAAFGLIYDRYAGMLFHFINSRIGNKDSTEEIIQEIFISFWNNREMLPIGVPPEPYLLEVAKDKVLTYVRSEPVIKKFANDFSAQTPDDSGELKSSSFESIDL